MIIYDYCDYKYSNEYEHERKREYEHEMYEYVITGLRTEEVREGPRVV